MINTKQSWVGGLLASKEESQKRAQALTSITAFDMIDSFWKGKQIRYSAVWPLESLAKKSYSELKNTSRLTKLHVDVALLTFKFERSNGKSIKSSDRTTSQTIVLPANLYKIEVDYDTFFRGFKFYGDAI